MTLGGVRTVAIAEKGLSIREFARREGCSDTLVRRAITQGRLKAKKDGTLDPALIAVSYTHLTLPTTPYV